MKILIKPEKFINCPAPSLTKGMMDWFYHKLPYIIPRRYDFKKIESINVRINQPYEGSVNYHFYVSVNSLSEIHFVYRKGIEDFDVYLYFRGDVDKSHYFRYDWIKNLDSIGFDLGTKKPTVLYNKRIEAKKQLDVAREEAKKTEERYSLYLELKKEFEHGE